MKFFTFCYLLVVILILNCCATAKGLTRASDKDVAVLKPAVLNGIYENVLPNDPENSLWQDLHANVKFKRIAPSSHESQVQVELVDEKTLRAHLIIAGERLESLELKGRIKNDYFVANRKFFIMPLILLNFYQDHKTIIGNLPNGDLHLVQSKKSEFFLIGGEGDTDSETINADYQCIDTTQVQILKKSL